VSVGVGTGGRGGEAGAQHPGWGEKPPGERGAMYKTEKRGATGHAMREPNEDKRGDKRSRRWPLTRHSTLRLTAQIIPSLLMQSVRLGTACWQWDEAWHWATQYAWGLTKEGRRDTNWLRKGRLEEEGRRPGALLGLFRGADHPVVPRTPEGLLRVSEAPALGCGDRGAERTAGMLQHKQRQKGYDSGKAPRRVHNLAGAGLPPTKGCRGTGI
jgi:hypothetical protein